MAINKIVFFCVTPLTKRDYDRFGGEVLKENGFDVWFYDFSPIVYPKLYKNCTFPDLHQPQNYFLHKNEGEGLKAIADLSLDSLIIMTLWYDSNTYKIFKTLSKTKIPYCVLANQSMPSRKTNIILQIFKSIKNILAFNLNTLKKILHKPQFANLWGIRRPDFCMLAGEMSLHKFKTLYRIGESTEILWTHSLDYDIFLKNSVKDSQNTGNQAVFLDPLAPMFQGDSIALGYKCPTSVENYYPSLCKFFKNAEKQLQNKIKIAAHPKSNYPPNPDCFGNRETVRGDTFGILKNSQFVIAHSSNAIQFAILLKKPILFLTTKEFENDKIFSADIKAFAHSLGKKPINIDKPLTVEWKKELQVDEMAYEEYINRHIKKRGSEELNSWQILANRIKRL